MPFRRPLEVLVLGLQDYRNGYLTNVSTSATRQSEEAKTLKTLRPPLTADSKSTFLLRVRRFSPRWASAAIVAICTPVGTASAARPNAISRDRLKMGPRF